MLIRRSSLALFFAISGLAPIGCLNMPTATSSTEERLSSGAVAANGAQVSAKAEVAGWRGTTMAAPACTPDDVSACGKATSCVSFGCEAGSCVEKLTALGADCSEGGDVCDGKGNCVLDHCNDQIADADETDEDCGGNSCSRCDLDKSCELGRDCASGVCVHDDSQGTGSAGVCRPCGSTADCQLDFACDKNIAGGTCVPKKVNGQKCATGAECASGFCPGADGVCCDTPCDGTCVACVHGKTGGSVDGKCSAVKANTDPDGECAADASQCTADVCSGSAGFCKAAPAGTTCRASTGTCDAAETCSGLAGATCPADQPSSCD